MRIFIDTNILIDFLSIRDKFYEDAKKIFTLGLLRKHESVISSLSIASALSCKGIGDVLGTLSQRQGAGLLKNATRRCKAHFSL